MKDLPSDELPVAANQKEIEKKLRDMLGPPPQEATSDEILESRGLPNQRLGTEVAIAEDNAEATQAEPEVVATETENDPAETVSEHTEVVPEDETTDDAVDDIVAKEGDAVLAAEDAEVVQAFQPPQNGFGAKLKRFFRNWWDNERARWATIIGIVAILISASILPQSRYFLLNNVGVRAKASLTVLDDSSQQPIKNIAVSLSGQTGLTDSDGKVQLAHLKLGKQKLVINKRAYAETTKTLTLGWGSNPLGSFTLKATGARIGLIVKDFLSSKPIDKAEAGSGEAISIGDEEGKVLIAIDPNDEEDNTLDVTAKGYRTEKVTLKLDSKTDQQVALVPSRKDVFVSKRSGKYDLYKVDVDGKNEAVVLKGTGLEQDNMALVPHPTDEVTAFVSTRENVRNSDGFLLSTLSLIDLSDNSAKTIGQSERIQVVGWADNRLVYLQVAAGTSAGNSKRYRLLSYDYKTSEKHELASGNYFNDTVLVGSTVYYAVANIYQTDPNTSFTKINADGSGKQVVLAHEVWNIFRSSYDIFTLSVGQDWYENKIGTSSATKLATGPASPSERTYVDSVDKKHSLWVDQRDGKGVLLSYDTLAKLDKILKSQSGLTNIPRWLSDNTVVYRIHTDQETADYVLNIDGGDARKIKDVTNTFSVEQGYY